MINKVPFDLQKTVFVIDGSSFLYRAYYGIRPMHTSKGIPVHAVFSFCRIIKKIIDQFEPKFMILVWDSKGKTVRHEIYEKYKAKRAAPPSDLFTQKKYIQEFADLIGLKQIEKVGYEADDIMYSIAEEQTQHDNNIVLVTSDKDMGQVLSENVVILDTFKNVIMDAKTFQENIGFPISKLPFYYSLLGDESDNIPGVRGIGKKGALELVSQFDSLENLYSHLDKIKKERTRTVLETSKNEAFLSYQLFLLRYTPTGFDIGDFIFDSHKWIKAQPIFEQLEFKTLLKDLQKHGIVIKEKEWLSKIGGYKFKTITKEEELNELCTTIKNKKICTIDTELTGINPITSELVGISLCVQKGEAYYIPFGHKTSEEQLPRNKVIDALKPVFDDPTIKKIMHHAKFDLHAIPQELPVKNLVFDTLIAANLVTQDWQRSGLKHLSKFYLNEEMLSYEDVVKNNGYENFSYVPLELATEYAASDAHQTFQLAPILQDELKKQKMDKLYDDIEFPLINVLLKMESEGIRCDASILKKIDEKILKDLESTHKEIISLISDNFKDINLNSPKQLEQLLFYELKLPTKKKSVKGTGYSTDQEVLEELSKIHPVPALIIRYRGLFKLKSTYIDALPKFINQKTGCIHTTFSQTRVATGRLASSEPNLQNIPTDIPEYDLHIRTAFISKEDHIFISADYSQIELRVLAYLSQDSALIDSFMAKVDIHSRTASGIFEIPIDQVTKTQRQLGKKINFSILYGLTPYSLSKDLNIPFSDAKKYIERFFSQYPGVQMWMEKIIDETKKNGYVTTLWSRRRSIPGIYEENKNLYELAKRIAINTVAQGTAAEIMKQGMIKVDAILQENKSDSKILLQIHDELIISVAKYEQKKIESIVKETLENVVNWNVPLEVDIRIGKNWQEVTK